MKSEPEDEEAIARVLRGEVHAFSILLRRHRFKVFRVGMSFYHDEDEAEDFTQDVFIKAYTALGSFRGASRFSTWLLRIAYNTAINAKRRRRETLRLEPDAELEGDPGADEEHMREQTALAVRKAVAELSSSQALCVELCFYFDMKYSEISEITGFPVNTVKSHVFRAKRLLRERLAKEAGDAL